MLHCLSDILHMSLFFIQHYTVSEEFEMFLIFSCQGIIVFFKLLFIYCTHIPLLQ